jgi:hypothetical protein
MSNNDDPSFVEHVVDRMLLRIAAIIVGSIVIYFMYSAAGLYEHN